MVKKLIIGSFLLMSVSFGQTFQKFVPFTTGNDTTGNIDAQDTLEYAIGVSELNWPAWELVTQCMQDTVYITVADKLGEVTKVYDIVNETDWTLAEIMKLRIRSSTDTLESNVMTISGFNGAATIFVQPDTMGTNTLYKVRVLVK